MQSNPVLPKQNSTPARGQALENWLAEQAAAAWDALKAHPASAISPQKLRARLAAEYAGTRQAQHQYN